MFEYIYGRVVRKEPTRIVCDVGGIAYSIAVPLSTSAEVVEGDEKKILIHLYVREEKLDLYGFATHEERQIFRLLLSVRGIGPTIALAILSGCPVSELIDSVTHDDLSPLVRVKGIGEKTACRLILELKDSIGDVAPTGETVPLRHRMPHDAVLALVSLGYSNREATKAVNKALKQQPDVSDVSDLIRAALKFA